MGKLRITKEGTEVKKVAKAEAVKAEGVETKEVAKVATGKNAKKRYESGILYVQSTYNNTKVLFTDNKGNALAWSSSGSLGFKGAKKGTPFAAAKIGEVVGQKALDLGVKEIAVIINGVGSGRESAVRAFVAKGINISSIKDVTPVPHNGPKPPKPRRV